MTAIVSIALSVLMVVLMVTAGVFFAFKIVRSIFLFDPFSKKTP